MDYSDKARTIAENIATAIKVAYEKENVTTWVASYHVPETEIYVVNRKTRTLEPGYVPMLPIKAVIWWHVPDLEFDSEEEKWFHTFSADLLRNVINILLKVLAETFGSVIKWRDEILVTVDDLGILEQIAEDYTGHYLSFFGDDPVAKILELIGPYVE